MWALIQQMLLKLAGNYVQDWVLRRLGLDPQRRLPRAVGCLAGCALVLAAAVAIVVVIWACRVMDAEPMER